jgi:hypothetical protein
MPFPWKSVTNNIITTDLDEGTWQVVAHPPEDYSEIKFFSRPCLTTKDLVDNLIIETTFAILFIDWFYRGYETSASDIDILLNQCMKATSERHYTKKVGAAWLEVEYVPKYGQLYMKIERGNRLTYKTLLSVHDHEKAPTGNVCGLAARFLVEVMIPEIERVELEKQRLRKAKKEAISAK